MPSIPQGFPRALSDDVLDAAISAASLAVAVAVVVTT
jgi:hypothetical protein